MDELIKRLKKSLSDFTAKFTDKEGFFSARKTNTSADTTSNNKLGISTSKLSGG